MHFIKFGIPGQNLNRVGSKFLDFLKPGVELLGLKARLLTVKNFPKLPTQEKQCVRSLSTQLPAEPLLLNEKAVQEYLPSPR